MKNRTAPTGVPGRSSRYSAQSSTAESGPANHESTLQTKRKDTKTGKRLPNHALSKISQPKLEAVRQPGDWHPSKRLLIGAFAVTGAVAFSLKSVFVQSIPKTSLPDPIDSPIPPCENFSSLVIGLLEGQNVVGYHFDAARDGDRFDQHCALIKKIDPNAESSYYKLMPTEYFDDISPAGSSIIGLFMQEDRSILVSADPISTPGDEAQLSMALRHENRHRDVHALNAEQNRQHTYFSQVDPCQSVPDQRSCQRDILKIRNFLNDMAPGRPLPSQCLAKLRKAERLIEPDFLQMWMDGPTLEHAKTLFPELIGEQTLLDGRRAPIRISLPKKSDKRFPVFMFHLAENTAKRLKYYDNKAKAFEQKEGDHLLAAEYDATLVGHYGVKAKDAIIEAASYFQANAELKI